MFCDADTEINIPQVHTYPADPTGRGHHQTELLRGPPSAAAQPAWLQKAKTWQTALLGCRVQPEGDSTSLPPLRQMMRKVSAC
eukprot:COSAG01_NODE_520_length_16006_cov_6.454077_7_plen_83_part_00